MATITDGGSGLGEMLILDDVLTLRAADIEQTPILAYPKPGSYVADFELFNGQDLDRFVDQAAKQYIQRGLSPDENKVVALSGPSDLDYVVSLFSLSRLGYTVLLLSPRLASNAVLSLLRETSCNIILHPDSAHHVSVIAKVLADKSVTTINMMHRSDYDRPSCTSPRFNREVDKKSETSKVAMICHSSGSTGLPKPIYQHHGRIIARLPRGAGTRDFSTFPWYHSWGNKVCVNTMFMRKTMYLWSSNQPMTADGLIQVLEAVKPGVLHAVPYVIKLLGEKKEGVEAMKMCTEVVYSGSQCPEKLGEYLVESGVRLGTLFGATEFGLLGSSMNRPLGDNSWNYIRFLPNMQPWVKMKPIGDNTYESVFLQGLPTLVATNSDDPPGSFHSRDLFTPHVTISGAWKYLGRLDDRITLANGEKVLPIPIEGRIRQEALVIEAVVFGIEKSVPGLLVIRSGEARNLADKEYVDAIWPAVEDANREAGAFSQISREMILPLPAGTEYPLTDKGSIIRAQVYKKFSDIIERAYSIFQDSESGNLELEVPELEEYLMKTFNDGFGLKLSSPTTGFFTAGMDSLQAIQARRLILRDISMGGNVRNLGQNVVFESGNVAGLAKRLVAVRMGTPVSKDNDNIFDAMQASINKYSIFEHHTPSTYAKPDTSTVVLTGATGSLGSHILAQLLSRHDVQKVYCLVRGPNPSERISDSLQQRGLNQHVRDPRIVALTSDLSQPDLGLDPETFDGLKRQTTLIIHVAWTVNFNLGFQAFEDNIRSVHSLVQLSLSVRTPNPARFFFCSSISVALGARHPSIIPEGPVEITQCSPGGYGRSKYVAEQIVQRASEDFGADAHILRIGQIVGDAKLGIWNDTEAIPLMIRSATTLKILPELNMLCSWLPVDTLASTILDLSFLQSDNKKSQLVYNLRSPHTFSWTNSFLPELLASGLDFKPVHFYLWLERLKDYAAKSPDEEAVAKNPAVKLVEYYERAYGNGAPEEGIVFEIGAAERDSHSLREAPILIEEGYIKRFVKAWMKS